MSLMRNTSMQSKPNSADIVVTAVDCWKVTEQPLNIQMAWTDFERDCTSRQRDRLLQEM
jgi:hypothetical protein